MSEKAASQVHEYEDKLFEIVRKLPDERIQQLVDFARFLEFQMSDAYEDWLIEETESEEARRADEEWDELLARPDSQRLLSEMAREARENYAAGKTTGITVTDDGELAPE